MILKQILQIRTRRPALRRPPHTDSPAVRPSLDMASPLPDALTGGAQIQGTAARARVRIRQTTRVPRRLRGRQRAPARRERRRKRRRVWRRGTGGIERTARSVA